LIKDDINRKNLDVSIQIVGAGVEGRRGRRVVLVDADEVYIW
jgi:hypothetical protein